MSLFDDDQRKVLLGVAIGAVGIGIVRGVAPAFRGAGRPLAKATIKSGMTLYEKGRERFARWGEVFEDLVAEARSELDEEARQSAAEPGPAGMPAPEGGSVQ